MTRQMESQSGPTTWEALKAMTPAQKNKLLQDAKIPSDLFKGKAVPSFFEELEADRFSRHGDDSETENAAGNAQMRKSGL